MNTLLKNSTLAAIVSLTLVACSTGSSSKTSDAASPTTSGNGMTDHSTMNMGGMNHSMMNMDLGPADADYDLRFIDAMTPHHQGAVDMAKQALVKSTHPEIKKLASNIIAAQNREIKEMKQWRQAWYPKADSTPMAYHAQMGHTMAMSPEQMQGMMMKGDLGAADAQFDLRFINAMIPHHEGAVTMAMDALTKTKHPEIKQQAQTIITSQQQEIDQMKQWRQAWYKQ